MPILYDRHALPPAPQRIVSLVPSLTESVAELGAAQRLVGITDWCWYPEEVVRHLPKIGGTKNPDLEAIRALAPDLILVNEEENRLRDVLALAEDFPCWATFPKHTRDNAHLIQDLAAITQTEVVAEQYLERLIHLEAQLESIVTQAPPRSMAYLLWRKPYMTCNRDTYVHAVLEALGFANPWAEAPERYPALEAEDFEEADPEVVLLSTEPFPFEEKHIEEFRAAFPELQATRNDKVVIEDGTYFCWYGTRWVRALEYFVSRPKWV